MTGKKKKSSKRYELDNTNKSENCNSQSQQHALVQAQTRSHQSSCGTGNLELTKKNESNAKNNKEKKISSKLTETKKENQNEGRFQRYQFFFSLLKKPKKEQNKLFTITNHYQQIC